MTVVAGGLNVYVCTYNPLKRNFSVSYTNNFIPQLFFFHNNCEFIVRGQFLAGFQANDPSLSALAVGQSIWYSCVAGMVYTRYAIISSESFNQYSYSDSRTTTLQLKNNIICIVDMTGIYTTADFDDGVPYAGVYVGISTPEAPHLMITNPQRNMNDTVDILVQDEYGSSFNDLFTPQSVDIPNCIGVSLWMEISF
jgi:hypothetical protein